MNSCITSQHKTWVCCYVTSILDIRCVRCYTSKYFSTLYVCVCVWGSYMIFCKIIFKRLNFEKYVCAMNISFYIKRQFTARKTADKIRNIKTRKSTWNRSFIFSHHNFTGVFIFTRIYHSRFNNFIVPINVTMIGVFLKMTRYQQYLC